MKLPKSGKMSFVVGMEKVKPKLDHNITLAGLLVTDADKANLKLEKATEPPIKGLFFFKKTIPTGSVYILNGIEFPNSEAVDFLLYLIWELEKNDWRRKITLESLNKVAKEVFGVKRLGKTERRLLERLLTIWKFHGYYFPNSFIWKGERVTILFGVIENWLIKSRGRGRASILEITFDEKFIEICRETDWYRRPSWLEVKKLRKETAKNLYLLALDYKPNEKSMEWKIYLDKDLKYWYRNSLNSLANPKYLKPYYVLKRLRGAIEEINNKTNLEMELKQMEEGNYCINVKERMTANIFESEKIKIIVPFDKLPEDSKSLLVNYLSTIAKEKGIKNIWGFLRSMSSMQIKNLLGEARSYFKIRGEDEKKDLYVRNLTLVSDLRSWGRRKFQKETIYKMYFGEGRIMEAYESEKKIVFVCKDRILAELLSRNLENEELTGLFGKKVVFIGEEEKNKLNFG
jgi:hypothetical protein